MKKRSIGIGILVLALLLLLSLCACGEEARPEQAGAASYVCTGARIQGRFLEPEELSSGDFRLELNSGGNGRLLLDGQEQGRLNWSLEGEKLTLTAGERSLTGTLSGGRLRLELPEEGLTLFFAAPGAEPEPEPALSEPLGGWYGCWIVTQTEGAWAELRGRRWDCCASAQATEEGTVLLTLWGEGGSVAAPLGRVELAVSEEGTAENLSGSFLGAELAPGAWSAGPEDEGLEELYLTDGRIETGDGALEYRLVLRPWGRDWEDAAAARPELLPRQYESWYLPLIEAGQPMPERMEIP